MNKICINKVCFEFSIYYFIYLIILIVIGNYIIDFFRTPKQKLKESLFNINYDIPGTEIYPGQYLTRSTLQTRSSEDIDEINKNYDKYNFTKPTLTYKNPVESSEESKQQKSLKKTTYKSEELQPLASGQGISNTNYSSGATRLNPSIDMIELPNSGLTDYELIRRRDLGVMADPLAPPEKRTERPQIDMTLPLLRNKYIGLPTRGSYDTYQQTGYLVDDTNPNNILKLFGRQKYSGSTQYEYYAMKSTAADQYKIPLNDIKKQLFDNDSVKLVKLFPGSYKYVEFKQEELI